MEQGKLGKFQAILTNYTTNIRQNWSNTLPSDIDIRSKLFIHINVPQSQTHLVDGKSSFQETITRTDMVDWSSQSL